MQRMNEIMVKTTSWNMQIRVPSGRASTIATKNLTTSKVSIVGVSPEDQGETSDPCRGCERRIHGVAQTFVLPAPMTSHPESQDKHSTSLLILSKFPSFLPRKVLGMCIYVRVCDYATSYRSSPHPLPDAKHYANPFADHDRPSIFLFPQALAHHPSDACAPCRQAGNSSFRAKMSRM
jgi:hypothetical protein